MARFAANEDTSHRSGIADPQGRRATFDFGGRRVREIRQMAFARVDDEKTGFARCSQDIAAGFHRARQLRDIVAERFPESAGLQEIALHVDDHQRGFRPDEFNWHRFGCEQIFGRGHRVAFVNRR
jgi:hypothetical protein